MAVHLSPEFLLGLAFGIIMLLLTLLGVWLDNSRRAARRSPMLPLHDYPAHPIIIHYHNWHHPLPVWWTSHPRPQIEMPRRLLLDPPRGAIDGQVNELEDEEEQLAGAVVT